MTPKALRFIAIAIAAAGLVDPAFTMTRRSRARVPWSFKTGRRCNCR
jgi:hypothetical protein